MSVNNFIAAITAELICSVNNNYNDNYDPYRYGEVIVPDKKKSIKENLIAQLNSRGYYNDFNNRNFAGQIKSKAFPYSDFFYLFDILEDENSKELLIKIIAYRILGHTKVKLPLNKPSLWNDLKTIEMHQRKDDVVSIGFMNQQLPYIDLEFLGLPIKLYYSAIGVNVDFIIKQYEFHHDDIHIQAEPGDVVIDAGGCFGDTALYFSNMVGSTGLVKTFEFIPNNIELLNRNLDLNPDLKPAIELINRPLWNESNLEVFFIDNGPGSKVTFEYFNEHTGKTKTITIDEFVQSSGLEEVNFIKMDVEGAETNALLGAKETIKKYRPKLAIALYHSTKDFERIPKLINDLGLGYRFYLSHATIYGEETMLFAKV